MGILPMTANHPYPLLIKEGLLNLHLFPDEASMAT